MPDPQVVATLAFPFTIASAFSDPTASINCFLISSGWRKTVKPSGLLSKKVLNGREKELGMCPEERPGRGSGSVPRNLKVR